MESSSAVSQVDTFRKKELICIEGGELPLLKRNNGYLANSSKLEDVSFGLVCMNALPSYVYIWRVTNQLSPILIKLLGHIRDGCGEPKESCQECVERVFYPYKDME